MIFLQVLGIFILVIAYIGFAFKAGEFVGELINSTILNIGTVLLVLFGFPLALAAQFHWL